MYSFVLQDRCTFKGTTTQAVVQADEGWLRLDDVQDVVVWWDVTESGTGNVNAYIQTAPTNDGALFVTLSEIDGISAGITPVLLRGKGAASPPSTLLRWQLVGNLTWAISFRILVSANPRRAVRRQRGSL